MLLGCKSDSFKSEKMPSWFMSPNQKAQRRPSGLFANKGDQGATNLGSFAFKSRLSNLQGLPGSWSGEELGHCNCTNIGSSVHSFLDSSFGSKMPSNLRTSHLQVFSAPLRGLPSSWSFQGIGHGNWDVGRIAGASSSIRKTSPSITLWVRTWSCARPPARKKVARYAFRSRHLSKNLPEKVAESAFRVRRQGPPRHLGFAKIWAWVSEHGRKGQQWTDPEQQRQCCLWLSASLGWVLWSVWWASACHAVLSTDKGLRQAEAGSP